MSRPALLPGEGPALRRPPNVTEVKPAASHPAALRVQSQGGEVFMTTVDRAGYRSLLVLSPVEAREVAKALFDRAADADTRAQAQALEAAGAFA